MLFLSAADFFKIIFFFRKIFQDYYQSVKKFESRSDYFVLQANVADQFRVETNVTDHFLMHVQAEHLM